MTGPKIPIGINPEGNPVTIEEAEHGKSGFYTCLECEEFLIARQGEVNAWHFAHAKGDEESADCTLRTEGGVENLLRTNRISPEEIRIREKRLRIIVRKDQYTPGYLLFGLIPALVPDDLKLSPNIFSDIDGLKLSGDCLRALVDIQAFQPNEPDVFIPLKPESSRFSVEIRTKNKNISRAGNWVADGLGEKNIFIGDGFNFERSNHHLQDGDNFIVLASRGSRLSNDISLPSIGELGNFLLFSGRFDEKTRRILEYSDIHVKTSSHNFGVDIVLPASANPNPIEPVKTIFDPTILIGILPTQNLNSKFEIISIPYIPGSELTIDPIGLGIPRFYSNDSNHKGTRKISVHWGLKHTMITILPQDDKNKINFNLIKRENLPSISVKRFDGSIDLFSPITDSNNGTIGLRKSHDSILLEEIDIALSPELPINIGYGFKDEFGKLVEEEIVDLSVLDGLEHIRKILEQIPDFIEIRFSNIGTVRFDVQGSRKSVEISDEDIKERITQKFVILPKKATNSVVRSILGITKGPGIKIPDGARKRIRNILREMKDGKVAK